MKFPLLIPAIYLTLILECFAQSAVFPIDVRRDVYLMGTRASLQTYAPDRQTGLNRIESFIRTLEDSEAELSTWRPDSAIRWPASPPTYVVRRKQNRWRDRPRQRLHHRVIVLTSIKKKSVCKKKMSSSLQRKTTMKWSLNRLYRSKRTTMSWSLNRL